MPRKLKTPCKGRTLRKCKYARKSCKITSGTVRRKYCRKSRNTRRNH